jgi:hypothetical protein
MASTKIADGFYRFDDTAYPSEGVKAVMLIDRIDGIDCDTSVTLSGGFCISGSQRHQFIDELGKLIDGYRI